MLILQPRQRVGHDILLARHGNHICEMRLDRHNDRVIALLDDGSVDSAPNLISPQIHMPETFRSTLRKDWRLLSAASGVMLAVSLVVSAIAMGLAGSVGDAQWQQIATNYQYTYANGY
ncbi:hypothetical protein [Arthrobacter sp. M4]|uniref:hypothetical protein n=1 Tax=Arthrobacter sp. M4 TaxID=218160 RepID=UPI001CDB98EE|nr:hypothetical protein [Arthrobacter sp. M4]MCA4135675.1 hypothetical protein [Arthrobacter sp. M4]